MVFANYCKPDGDKLLGIPHAFDDEAEGEVLSCPLCGRIPKPMVRVDSLDGYFSAVSCFGGTGATHAYVSKKGHGNYMDILNEAIREWNEGELTLYKGRERYQWSRQTEMIYEEENEQQA